MRISEHVYGYWGELKYQGPAPSFSHKTLAEGYRLFGESEYDCMLSGYFQGEALVRQMAVNARARELLCNLLQLRGEK